jgi:hypothetical protein
MTVNSAQGITWDLSDLFSSYDDPRIDATLKEGRAQAEALLSDIGVGSKMLTI